jgi:hypothetical protein
VLDPARGIAVDQQQDIAAGDKLIDQPLLGGVMHPGTAVQSDDGGKRAGAIGPRQIALDAHARNEPARQGLLGGAVEFDALQRRGRCIGDQRAQDAAERQDSDCSRCRQCRLP